MFSFQVHISFQNAEPLIEKFNQDLFERYELIRDQKENNYYYHITKQKDQPTQNNNNNTITESHTHSSSSNKSEVLSSFSSSTLSSNSFHNSFHNNSSFANNTSPPPLPFINYNYYYYDTTHNDLMNINSIHIDSNESYRLNSTMSNTNDKNNNNALHYPLSFIDAVNRKQLDLESGFFKEPKKSSSLQQHGAFTLSLSEAINSNLLNPRTAYLTDANLNRSTDLKESIRLGLITSKNRVVLASSGQTLSLADALKTGHLKIGEQQPQQQQQTPSNGSCALNSSSGSNSSCSMISSETQSMSVRSIRDPSTSEFLAPTEAIKRKLLDPYKGLFVHPLSGERMPISEAIQKGFVIVEMINNSPGAGK